MNFGHPKVFWVAVAILPLLGLFLWATWRRRQALVRFFVQNKNLSEMTLGTSTARQKLRRVLLFCAVASLLFTAARPQWGFTWEEATQRGRDVIVAIDTSRSMLAADLQPNRLARARLAALDLLKLGKFDRFALVAFSGSAFLQCPLTFDDEAFRQSVQILEPGIIPQGGTAISEAIDAARRAFSEDADQNHRVLVLFTDGEDHEKGVMETVASAANEGMKIFTVGVGTPAGELLRVRDERGNVGYVKDDAGNVVKSRLNEPLLREIAAKTGGFYLPLQGANTMEVLYQKGLAPLPTSERSSKLLKRFKEQFYWPLSIAILLLMIEVFIPEQKRALRKTELAKQMSPSGALAALLLLTAIPATNADAKKAARLYKEEQYKSALAEYLRLIEESPNNLYLRYNAGASAFNLNKFDVAAKAFEESARSKDLELQQQSFYNLGNTYFRLGENEDVSLEERIRSLESAVRHFETALNLQPKDPNAQFNLNVAKQKLEELKKQQQQQNQKQQNNNQEKQDEKQEEKEKQKNPEQQQNEQKNNEQKDENSEEKQQQQKENSEPKQDDQGEPQNQHKQQQQQQSDQQEKKDGQQSQEPRPQQNGDKPADQLPPESQGQAQVAQLGQMTPAQAKQLLDAQKNEEKALIFVPQESKSESRNRTFKDW